MLSVLGGLKLLESPGLLCPGGFEEKMRVRTWEERLFTLPWRPWRRRITTRVMRWEPDPNVYIMDDPADAVFCDFGFRHDFSYKPKKVIVGHPETLRKLKEYIVAMERGQAAGRGAAVVDGQPAGVGGATAEHVGADDGGDRVLRKGGAGWPVQPGLAETSAEYTARMCESLLRGTDQVGLDPLTATGTANTYAGAPCSYDDLVRLRYFAGAWEVARRRRTSPPTS
jgi:hypothetical protein